MLTIVTQEEKFRFNPRHRDRPGRRTTFRDLLAFWRIFIPHLRDSHEGQPEGKERENDRMSSLFGIGRKERSVLWYSDQVEAAVM